MENCLPKELNKQEQRIVNDIMQRSNLNLEDATTIARTMIEWGYTIHEQDYNRLKIAFDILKEKLDIKLEVYHCGGCTLNHKIIPNCVTPNERCLRYLEVEEYELLKEVLENDR